MKTMQSLDQKIKFMLTLIVMVSVLNSCKKDEDMRVPPSVEFKTGAGYTSADATVGQGAAVLVGIVATKTEDEMQTFNVSYAYDGSATTITDTTIALSGAEEDSYSTDYTITTRNQAGMEQWSFTITDRDGNITTKSITLTVQ